MTRGCENRAKCGRLEGAALFAQAAEHTSMSPGKDGEESAASRTAGPEGSQNPKHQSSASPLELHPTVEPTRNHRYPNPSGICLSGTGSPQAGGPGDSDRPELEAALLWGCLWDCLRIPVLPMGLPEPARSEQSLSRGTGLGIL